MKIVCDTNVIVSGILFGGHPRMILSAIARNKIEAFTTSALLGELQDVLLRKKFRLTVGQVEAALELIRESFACVPTVVAVSVIDDDPDDNRVLEAALAADAEVIVSGDAHLLQLTTWRSIRIMPPVEFVKDHLAKKAE